MEVNLNFPAAQSPMDFTDIKLLKYIWEISNGYEAHLYIDKIPQELRDTPIFQSLFERLSFYKEKQHLISDFELNDEVEYYVMLEDGFISRLNLIIDDVNQRRYITVEAISHVQEKGQIIMSNTINNNGTFNAPVNSQIGRDNSNLYFQEQQKKEGIKINFVGMAKAILKKIPFLKDFVE